MNIITVVNKDNKIKFILKFFVLIILIVVTFGVLYLCLNSNFFNINNNNSNNIFKNHSENSTSMLDNQNKQKFQIESSNFNNFYSYNNNKYKYKYKNKYKYFKSNFNHVQEILLTTNKFVNKNSDDIKGINECVNIDENKEKVLLSNKLNFKGSDNVSNVTNNYLFNDEIIGYLSIPKINLYDIRIKNGVGDEILKDSIGLFDGSNIKSGNICLAAHNRSSTVSYFKKLHTLKSGDEILLKNKYGTNAYIVEFNIMIDSNDWTYLSPEDSDMLTCITCVNNNAKKRICVRANRKV